MPALSVIVPTYNERDNVALLYQGLCAALSELEIIFVDDGSPDGTAEVIRSLKATDSRVKLVQRPGKMGLGSAVLCGLEQAQGEWVAMMDADLSHNPADLPRLMAAMQKEHADLVVASRYVKGGGTVGWPWRRRLTSRGAILLARWLLPIKVRDPLSGFALFRRSALEGVRSELSARGFKLVLEILVKAPHLRVAEVPITFVERARGHSKMGIGEIRAFLSLCLELRRWQRKGPVPH